MPIVESERAAAPPDPRLVPELADLATGATPAWLWSADGSRLVWANAVGAAVFSAAGAGDYAARRFDPRQPPAAEIARLAATLPLAGQARLERLRGFGASFGGTLTCVCSRLPTADGGAVLVAAAEPIGPSLSLRDRAARLFEGTERALVIFAADGSLLYATEAANRRLNGAAASALGIADLLSQARTSGRASGETSRGAVSVHRLGKDASTVLIAEFGANAPRAENRAVKIEPQPLIAAASVTPAATAPARTPGEVALERRHPLRFVWQMDADGRFVVGSDEFLELMGPRTTAAFGRLWSEIAAELKLDPHHQIAHAVATQETWSGITISWPVDDGGERLPVELSGLPVFDRDRAFRGYRGFGVCRDLTRINDLVRARRERPIGFIAPLPSPSEDEVPPLPAMPGESVASADGAAQPTGVRSAPEATESAVRAERAALSVVQAAANVVPFRQGVSPPPEPKPPTLSPVERKAFSELAQELTARLRGGRDAVSDSAPAAERDQSAVVESPQIEPSAPPAEAAAAKTPREQTEAVHEQTLPAFEPALLDRIPIGVLIYRHDGPRDALLYANRHFLELSGHENLGALAAVGGLDKLFAEPTGDAFAPGGGTQSLSLVGSDGERRPVEGRLFTIPWGGATALALILVNGEAEERRRSNTQLLAAAQGEIRELKGHVESFKKTEAELRAATREAQRAAATKAEFVSKVSHEIRTPLNAITGFAELMIAERFGPIGNERYADYLKDIHAAGMHVVALLNDLLDLSKIETGQLDLAFANVSLNDLTQQCVGLMQPQASRARIIIRTSLTPGLPQVVADERSLRQIVLNLLSNSIKFTGPGGQVIVSTAFADSGEAVLRVRDTGVGMNERDVEAALEPFRQTAISGSWGSGGTGLGLPLTKALAEANRAHFSIKSAPNAGTLVEVAFPPTRVVAR
jgi:signal transduction histidine kinase